MRYKALVKGRLGDISSPTFAISAIDDSEDDISILTEEAFPPGWGQHNARWDWAQLDAAVEAAGFQRAGEWFDAGGMVGVDIFPREDRRLIRDRKGVS